MAEFDFIVIGAGIAGASAAAHLAQHARVCILEMEERAGYHTTGRSAASYEPYYGPGPVQILTRAAGAFFNAPPSGFADAALFKPRGSLIIEARGQEEDAAAFLKLAKDVRELDEAELRALYPALRPGYALRGFFDESTGDLDVDLLHRSFLRQFKQAGGKLFVSAGVTAINRTHGTWQVETPQCVFSAKGLVNAAGAWGDHVARLAGVAPLGLVPKRRSIGVIPIAGFADFMAWPFIVDCAESWYAKPQSGKMLVSSADVTPVEAHDAYADDEAIALGIERMMEATTLEVTRVEHRWGGLRTFTADKVPAVGYDPQAEDFFWLVGQGGYGIQSSPALSRLAAALALREPVPEDIAMSGLDLDDILPQRFRP